MNFDLNTDEGQERNRVSKDREPNNWPEGDFEAYEPPVDEDISRRSLIMLSSIKRRFTECADAFDVQLEAELECELTPRSLYS